MLPHHYNTLRGNKACIFLKAAFSYKWDLHILVPAFFPMPPYFLSDCIFTNKWQCLPQFDKDDDQDDNNDEKDGRVPTWLPQMTKQPMKRRMYCAHILMEMHILSLYYDYDFDYIWMIRKKIIVKIIKKRWHVWLHFLYCADIVMEMHIVTMNDKHDDDNADHSMTTINRSREVSTMWYTQQNIL